MNKVIIIGFAIALLSACSETEPTSPEAKEIQVSATIVATRSVMTDTDQFDGIHFLRWDDENSNKTSGFDFSQSKSISGSRAADGTVTFFPPQNYDLTSKTTYLVAYYPAGTLKSGVVTWKIDGSTDIITTNTWNAGNYTTPQRKGMDFNHRLARIEVICQADQNTPPEIIQSVWGDVVSIKFANTLPTLTYSYATNRLSGAGEAIDLPLLNTDRYEQKPFTPSPIAANNTKTITASAMLLPMESNTIKLKVTTSKKEEKEITVSLNDNIKEGKIHTITLTFFPDGKQIKCNNTVIIPWQPGANGEEGIPE